MRTEYWKELLTGVGPCRFPTLDGGEHLTGEIKATEVLLHETSRLTSLCEREGVLPSIVFQTAWALVLKCYIATDSICFAYLITEDDSTGIRDLDATNPVPGLLICCTQLTEGSITNQLGEMQTKFDYGMPWKVRSSEIGEVLNVHDNQLFNTALSVNQQSRLAPVVEIDPLPGKGKAMKYDLIMDITHVKDQIAIVLRYNSSILLENQATIVTHTFATALREIVTNPEQNIERIGLFSERDRTQIWKWNSTTPRKVDVCVHHLIEDQARSHPGSPAICSWNGNMTYRELNMLSTQLAHHLVRLGVGPEVMVPLCFEKSIWAVVAMLAVLKAGGAFVPLDPSHPIGRLESIAIQVNASVILSSTQHERLFSPMNNKVIAVSQSTLAELPVESNMPCTSVCPSNAAYIIFTSGSTGAPKGCVIEHAAYCSSALAHGKTIHIESGSRVFQFASYSFDACLVEILTTLILGSCICIPSEDERVNSVAEVMNRMNVNWASFVPSVARLIEPESVPHLKTLVLIGESASQKDLKKWTDSVQLFNGYGPTECAVGCVYQKFNKEKLDARCIGRGVGANCWVVDALDVNRLRPIGAVGELLIEGPCLGRGYLNDKAKTDTVFIENLAWIPDDGTMRRRRLYKTGDLVRYNSDGTIHFVGRKDTQVKVRGQRAELGEIEYHLMASMGVKNATIVVRGSGTRNQQLVAVVSLHQIGTALEAEGSHQIRVVSEPWKGAVAANISAIRKNMSDRLPVFMIPMIWIVVEEIPLLASGKLDKAKVAKWAAGMSDEELLAHSEFPDENPWRDPRNALQERLRQIWCQVLNIPLDRVRMDKSFLNLGGDSISAMEVMARCRAENMVVTAQDILRYKTIPQLALYLQTARDSVHIIESETEDRLNTPFALSPIQQFYFDSMQNGDDQFNQSFLLQFTKKIPAENIALAIQAIIEQHSMLRARFSHESDGQWTQRIISEVLESYQFRRHDTIDIDDIALIVKTSQASLNIRDGPLFAADFFDDGDEQILFLTAHHLVIDLVSWRIILSDLEDFLRYGTISAPKPLPFQAWSGAQAKHCRQHLNPRNALPFDVKEADYGFWGMSQRPNRFEDVATEVFTMEHDMTAKLFGTCNNALRTEPIELLLSAVIYSFSRAFPERQTPTVFNENHGREPWHASIDPSRTIGWFTTFYPLWVPVDDQEDVVKVIRRTKDQRRQIPDNGWPYFTSRFLHPEGPEAFAKHSKMEVLLNYEGIYQQLERNDALFRQSPWANPRVLGDCGGNVHRSALLELTATAKHGILHFCFEYNRYMDHTDRIKHWVRECERTLREAIEQLMQGNIEYTLSDFPLLPLSYSDLARFVDTTLPSIGILKVEEIEDAYLCSPLQQGMLISQSKQTTLYHIQVVREVMPVEGCSPVDAQRLGAAWQKVVDHHAILRTVFVENICQGGNFGQVVLKKATAAVRYIQWDDSSDDRNGPAKAFDNRSFDDGAKYGPPHRLTICTTSGGRIFFSLEISHTITDGISLSLTLRDLSFAYDAMLPRSPGPLYRNYIAYIRDQNTTDGIEYWKHYVKNVVPCYFPATVQKSDRQAGSGVIDLSFDAFRLRAFCQQHGVSIYNVLQTVWALVLRVFANEDEVCFGYIGSGREIPIHRVQDAVGPYITMLICRVGFSPTESVSEVLHRVHNDFVSSLPHQHACSLAEIQHELKMSGKPLFNSGISVQKGQTESWKSGSFKLRNIKWEDPSEHDIAVNATESRETVSLTFRYLKRSMSEERMSNVAYTFVTILREVIRNPEQTVKQLSHFGERNRNPLWGWNGIVPDKKDACELGAIEYHLRSFLPDGIDVVAELITPVDEESQTILAVFICLRDVLDNGDHGLEDVPVVTRERLISIVAELEEWLSNSLPEYMIPTMFVPLRRIPLTASGKPDRQKLHQLVSGLSKQQLTARSLDASAKRAPSMELEKRLQLLWANVLNVRADRIGIGDNFFKLGGDSITAMRLVATARAAGIYISVADVFNHSTLSELSLSIAAAEGLTEFGIPTCTSSGTTKTAESFPHDALLQRTTSRALTKELEKQLQQLWAGVLNLRADSIGISDNFFKLGGDSITAMRLVATARSSGIHISIAHIFGHPTLLDLSLALSIPDRLRRSAKRHTHFPFSSLDFPDVEEFLEEVVCPQITSERFNIEDALIATDMQAAMIAFGLSRNRGNIHYFTLDFDGHIDSSRLKTACQTLISHHPIFRTVFFAHKSQVFQILLRSIPLEFQRYECENSIEDLSKQLINTDRSLPFAPGDRIVRFMFLEHGTYSARLIIRVSHAQYDGICFPIIIKDLKAAYLGEKIEARPPFSDFVYAINKRNGTKAELFWRTLLENSSMTKFSLYKIPSYENHIDSCVMRSIPFISLGSHGITLASIIKAAWAFILAQLSGTNDVVFGHVVSGRNLFLEGIDQIVGPCINVVPVRVRFQSSTVLDLLCLVQNQYLEAIPFETMGFRRIVERCTEWPLWSRFSSVVQHQNLDEILTSCRFGDTNCKIGAISAPHDVVDVAILSSQQGRKTGISLNYSRRVISQPFAEEVLESLCSTILQFSTDVNAQLPSPSSWSTPYPRIPFLNDTGHGQPLCSIQPSKALVAYQSVVERAWKFVMKAGVGDCTDDFCDPSIPFFDIWGGLIAAAQLSAFYRQEGIQITMEEVLSHPTIGLQTLLVAQRSGVK